jgi:hypothetical protein
VGLVYTIGVNEEKGGTNSVELFDRRTAGITEELAVEAAILAAGEPAVLDPSPGPIVYIHEILIVKVDFREVALRHGISL